MIDANGVPGYQAGQDLVIELASPVLPIDPTAGFIKTYHGPSAGRQGVA